jgi:hypothetical protein
MKCTASFTIFPAAFVLCLQAVPAQAQSPRTFVSGTGSDASATCGRAAPCRTFAGAIGKTDAGGEIVVLDAAGYGPVVIEKSITITNDGVGTAAIRPTPGGVGILIDAKETDVVNLRGLSIDGNGGTGASGIVFTTGASLNVQNCVIQNIRGLGDFSGVGILFTPAASSSLTVSDTLVANISGLAISIQARNNVKAVLNRVQAYNSTYGLYVDGNVSIGTINVTVADSVAANNDFIGFAADSGKAVTNLMLVRSVSANNATGIASFGPKASVLSAQSTVTGNRTGWNLFILSFGDNYVGGNTDDGGFPRTIPTR